VRVLIATDGSTEAQRAVTLAAAQAWPEDSVFLVITVDDGRHVAPALPDEPAAGGTQESAAADLATVAEAAAGALRRPGWTARADVLVGRAASAIVEAGQEFEADVIVLGSRGRGMLQTLALGSVSAEVVDHANRAVLVARGTDPIHRVLLADDGSDPAAKARLAVAEWPIFDGAEVTVTSVSHVSGPIHSAIAPTVYRAAMADYARSLDAARDHRDQTLRAAAMELQVAGRRVAKAPRDGDPAGEILAAAAETGADLIVVGSRGQGGLARLLLGSVARNVLYGAACSVLVVR
jgi:nucleotide-binding universal stress UspA family protein